MENRPWGITLACAFLAIIAVLSIYGGATLGQEGAMQVLPQDTEDVELAEGEDVEAEGSPATEYVLPQSLQPIFNAWGAMSAIVIGALFAIVAYMLWNKNELAWYASFGLVALAVVADIVLILIGKAMVTAIGIVALGVFVVMLLALTHKDTISEIRPEHFDYPGWEFSEAY